MKATLITIAIGLSLATATGVTNQNGPQKYTRRSVFKLSAQELEDYRDVVRAMQAKPVSDQRSWLYQSGIHQSVTPDDVNNAPLNPADKTEMLKYALTPPQHAVDNNTWNQCHQTSPDIVFLLWHRVYLYYFEQIARKVSGKATFAVPYWDYTKGAAGLVPPRQLPQGFRTATYKSPGDTQSRPNPLFAVRRAAINNGNPLTQSVVSFASVSTETDFTLFSVGLENNPHNSLHGAVGKENSLLMGATVWAAQDPIFWLHHANMDRLWKCWERRGNTSVTPNDTQTYRFINEDGNVVSHSVTEMAQLAKTMQYDYEDFTECDALSGGPVGTAAGLTQSKSVFSRSDVPVKLGGRTVSIPIQLPAADRQQLRNAPRTGQQLKATLVLENIKATGPVGVMYEVRLRKRGSSASGRVLGVISFFAQNEGMLRPHHQGSGSLSLTFDATDAITALAAGPDGGQLELQFVPTTGVAGQPISAAQSAFRPASEPQIGTIRLALSPSNP